MVVQHAVFRGRERATDLVHEELVRMWCRPNNLDAARRQIDHEHGVIRDETSPRPDFRREEICSSNRTPMGPQKRLPGCRSVRYGRQAMCLEDARDRRATDPMPDVLQRALDPRMSWRCQRCKVSGVTIVAISRNR